MSSTPPRQIITIIYIYIHIFIYIHNCENESAVEEGAVCDVGVSGNSAYVSIRQHTSAYVSIPLRRGPYAM
jgi:hypothetical protein